MFIGVYVNDEKEKAVKKAIKEVDPNIEILDSDNCLEFTWDQEYIEDAIDLRLKNISKEEKQRVLEFITKSFLSSDFPVVNEEVELFIEEVIQKYKKENNY